MTQQGVNRLKDLLFDRERGEIEDSALVEAAVAMLTGMSWLHLFTNNLPNGLADNRSF